MSRTKETKLLMESWRNFINENAMDSSILLSQELVEKSLNVFDSYMSDLDSSKDELIGKIFWDSEEGDLQLIVDLDDEGYELTSICCEGETVSKWVREDFISDFNVDDLLDMEELKTIKRELDSDEVEAPGDFDKVFNLKTNEVEIRHSDSGKLIDQE